MRKFRDKRLYERGNKIWCRVPGADGRIVRKATNCTDETAAAARADDFERRFANPAYAAAAATTLDGCLNAYLLDLERRGRASATIAIATQKIGHFARVWGRARPMSELANPNLWVAYIDQRLREGVTRFTVSKELGHAGQFLRLAHYLGTFPVSPERVLPPFFHGDHKPRQRKPSQDEVHAACRELDPWRVAHVAFLVGALARRSEAARARRVDVDLALGVVHVRGTKTEAADDDVPITPITRPWLELALSAAPGKDLLFRPWGNLSRDMAAACVRANVARITPNDLRRASASWHRDAGLPAELVSKLLRHTTDKLAQTTYAKLGPVALGQLVSRHFATVPLLYPNAARTDPIEPQRDIENSDISRAILENRTRDLRFTKPYEQDASRRIKIGMARVAEKRGVPILYERRPAWLFEATANLACLLAGVRS